MIQLGAHESLATVVSLVALPLAARPLVAASLLLALLPVHWRVAGVSCGVVRESGSLGWAVGPVRCLFVCFALHLSGVCYGCILDRNPPDAVGGLVQVLRPAYVGILN